MTSRFKDSLVVPFAQAAPEDALRTMLTTLIHETLEREFATFVGADRFERTPARQDVRNGYRRRRFVTRVSTLTLRIPRDRQGRFQPSLFARYQRHE
jgi:transposase-like protein